MYSTANNRKQICTQTEGSENVQTGSSETVWDVWRLRRGSESEFRDETGEGNKKRELEGRGLGRKYGRRSGEAVRNIVQKLGGMEWREKKSPICPSANLSVCGSVCLSTLLLSILSFSLCFQVSVCPENIQHWCIRLPFYQSFSRSSAFLAIDLGICLSVSLLTGLVTCLSIQYPSIFPFISLVPCQSTHLSVQLSIPLLSVYLSLLFLHCPVCPSTLCLLICLSFYSSTSPPVSLPPSRLCCLVNLSLCPQIYLYIYLPFRIIHTA